MKRFTNAIRESLKTKNWYSAIYLSLTLPDICARLESPNGKTSGKKYAAWFDKYMAHHYRFKVGINQDQVILLSGNDCYALRCALLHEGGVDITTQKIRESLEKFHFTTTTVHGNRINTTLQLDVPTFCTQICSGAEQWQDDFTKHHPDKQYRMKELVTVFEGPHSMDGYVYFG